MLIRSHEARKARQRTWPIKSTRRPSLPISRVRTPNCGPTVSRDWPAFADICRRPITTECMKAYAQVNDYKVDVSCAGDVGVGAVRRSPLRPCLIAHILHPHCMTTRQRQRHDTTRHDAHHIAQTSLLLRYADDSYSDKRSPTAECFVCGRPRAYSEPPTPTALACFTHSHCCDRAETESRTGRRQRSAVAVVAPNPDQEQRQVLLPTSDNDYSIEML